MKNSFRSGTSAGQYCRMFVFMVCCATAAGCMNTVQDSIIRDELLMLTGEKITEVTLDDGSLIRFNSAGGRLGDSGFGMNAKTVVEGFTWDGKTVSIDLDRILAAKLERKELDAGNTAVVIFIGTPVTVIFAALFVFIIS